MRSEVERMMGRELKTSSDFAELSDRIYQRTRERLSPTTLKRLWGYLDEPVTPRLFTLTVLSRFLGFTDYDAFCASSDGIQSNPILAPHITNRDLKVGDRLRLTWRPDRVCVVEHLGCCGTFRVVEAENTKLAVGDTFRCHLFIAHEPLFLDDLVHEGGEPVSYVAGRQDGIVYEVVSNK